MKRSKLIKLIKEEIILLELSNMPQLEIDKLEKNFIDKYGIQKTLKAIVEICYIKSKGEHDSNYLKLGSDMNNLVKKYNFK